VTTNGKGARVLSILGVAMLLSSGLLAQKKTRDERREEANSRTVQGLITGADEKPIVGAVVQLKDMRSLQVRSFITQDDGTYHFSGLKGDIEYQVTAKAGDTSAGPKTLSIFDSRKEAILNFKLDKK
jgi:LPXTG-motif cell wall-anchored protein